MKLSWSSSFLGSPLMKRLLLLSLGCCACLIAGATTGAKADVSATSATIEANGEVPSACFVTGTSLGLELSDRNKLSATGATEMQSSGPATFSLDKVAITEAPDFAKGNLLAEVLLSSSKGKLIATAFDDGSLSLKEPLVDEKIETSVSVSSSKGVLPAGKYELSTTLTCVSD
jgi:hypothetical protein